MVTVIDYGVGNLFSVAKAIAAQGVDVVVSGDKAKIAAADKIVLPGVGAFGDCMKNFYDSGVVPTLLERLQNGVPLLGICVGLQILFEGSEESPDAEGLGLIKGKVRLIDAAKGKAANLKVPHMGWNLVHFRNDGDKLWKDLPPEPFFYFVHSYHGVPVDESVICATCEYGGTVTAALKKDNIFATQFHPEKSGDVGQMLLHNFLFNDD